jgi:hypothetical protein
MPGANATKNATWDSPTWMTPGRSWLLLGLITLIALGLRLFRLGDLGLRLDEDLFGVAVGAILESGEPRFPSGLLYLRSGPLLYLTAAAAALTGLGEFSLRLPAALFGVALVPLSYLFLKRLQGPGVALLVALAVAVGPWDLDLTRYARMYGPFAFCFVMTAYACYFGLLEGQRRWAVAALLLSTLTVTIHQLGFTAALFFVIPLLIRDREGTPLLWMVLGVLVAGAALFTWRGIINAGFDVPYLLNNARQQTKAGDIAEAGLVEQVIEKVNLPPVDLLAQLLKVAPWGFWLLCLIAGVLIIGLLTRALRARQWSPVFLAVLVLCCFLHQLTFGFVALIAWVYAQGTGLRGLLAPRIWAIAAAVAAAFLAWWWFGVVFGEPNRYVLEGRSTQLVQTAKLFVSYPGYRITWGYLTVRPIMSLLAMIGIALCLDRGSRGINERANLFLVLAFVGPILTNGLFESTQRFRYNFHLETFYYGLVAIGLVKGWQVILEIGRPRISDTSVASVSGWLAPAWIGTMALAVLLTDFRLTDSWRIVNRGYGDTSRVQRQLGLPFYPDHKTTGSYVRQNLRPGDIVITMDWIQQYHYVGQSDYVIRSDFYEHWSYPVGEQRQDIYIAAEIIPDERRLRAVLEEHQDQRVWLITSPRRYGGTLVSQEIVNWIEAQTESRVYVGEDDRTEVYLLEAGWQEAHPAGAA